MTTNDRNSLCANTSPTKAALNSLTRDVTVQSCIFELIDNSIDAKKDGTCEITIQLIDSIFSIQDNASGISLSDFENSALRFGRVNAEKQSGIGAFGIGLNRAILTLGKELELLSETKDTRVSVAFNIDNYLKQEEWNIPISKIEKIGNTGTLIKITLKEEINSIFSDDMIKELQMELSKRYGYLIQKEKCVIHFNDKKIDAAIPTFRENGDFRILKKSFIEKEVEVDIKLGQHQKHRFSYEDDYNQSINKEITSEQGWFVYCNDRAILLNEFSEDVGWETKLHSQHYGVVGEIHFRGKSNLLPWGTDKVNTNLNNEIYKKALPFMKEFSSQWRKHSGDAKAIRKGTQMSLPQIANVHISSPIVDPVVTPLVDFNNDDAKQSKKVPSQISASIDNDKPTLTQKNSSHNVAKHPNTTKYLFGDSQNARAPFKPRANIKIQAVVNELQQLEIDKYTCSVQFLLRSLIEESSKYYILQNPITLDEKYEKSLSKTVRYLTENHLFKSQDDKKDECQEHNRLAILSVCSPRGDGSATIEALQMGVHSSHDFLSPSDIRALWRKIQPFITQCLK
jgi:hypothetical protein